jgi:RNA ligase
MSIDLVLLRQHIANGIVCAQPHPTLPLTIFNYSQRCQYERLWDDVTLQCRGLVVHGDKIAARPFRKFFNDTEHDAIPWHIEHEITEKLDGSLLIAFYFDGDWRFATRGSFVSDQANEGERIFRATYDIGLLDPANTYLFEVIYPENRIVVDYGGRRDTILLAVIRTEDGQEQKRIVPGLKCARSLPAGTNPEQLRSIIKDDQEGYVVRFANGLRVKVKGERYIRLHRLITLCSSRTIWEHLSNGTSFNEMIELVPDEFMQWVDAERKALESQFTAIKTRTSDAVAAVASLPDRKSKAMKIMSEFKDVAAVAFAALDSKPLEPIIWKMVYPEFRRPEIAGRIET